MITGYVKSDESNDSNIQDKFILHNLTLNLERRVHQNMWSNSFFY